MNRFAAWAVLLLFAASAEAKGTCGTVVYPSNTGFVTSDPIIDSPKVWSFISEPHLHPMKIKVNTFKPGTHPGAIFVAPYAFSEDAVYGQTGSLIMDSKGNPIWFRPLSNPNLMNTDFRVQHLCGKPVLTFWQGTLATPPAYTNAPGGSSEPGSCYYILDNTYRVIKTVSARKGYTSDIHEFLLTPNNSALFLSTKAVPMDLSPYGGPANGYVQDFAIQEVDLCTNRLIFFWNALKHIPLSDSFQPASSASDSSNIWDAYHLNSVGLTDNVNEIILSGRNTWTIYKINKTTGKFVWRLGGKQSDFTIESGASFSWQHDARFLPPNRVSMFDDNCCESSIPPGTPYAHGLILQLNLEKMTAKVNKTYFHDPNLQVASQGNVQSLSNGNKFIGWGQTQYFSEYKKAGNEVTDPAHNTLYSAQMPGSNYTYRAYRDSWTGNPHYPPKAVLKSKKIYVSWNGSTETTTWQVYAGPSPGCLKLIKTVPKTGFETAIEVGPFPYYKVGAFNAAGRLLRFSRII